jgi:hypothetical protein
MLEELKAENPAEELIKLIKHWMVIKKAIQTNLTY